MYCEDITYTIEHSLSLFVQTTLTTPESLITGTITPNQPATLKQCLGKLGGGNSALLIGNQ